MKRCNQLFIITFFCIIQLFLTLDIYSNNSYKLPTQYLSNFKYFKNSTRFTSQLYQYLKVYQNNQFRAYHYKYFKGLNPLTGQPEFAEKIREEDLKDHPYYFKKYLPLIRVGTNKGFFIYEYFKNQTKLGSFIFEINYDQKNKKIGKVILKVAIWYNQKEQLNQVNIYSETPDGIQFLREKIFYNDYGVPIKKIIAHPSGSTTIETEFTPEDQIIGPPEY